jgi:hypothetical protein
MGRDMGPILDKIAQLEDSNVKLTAFAKEVIGVMFDGGGLDGFEIQDLAVKHELLFREPYDPEKHGDDHLSEIEPGEMIYMHSDILRDNAIDSTENA